MTFRDVSVSVMGSQRPGQRMLLPRNVRQDVALDDAGDAQGQRIVEHEGPIQHLVCGASPRDAAGGTAGNGFSHPRQAACRLQRHRCADGERHGKARLTRIS